MAAASLLITLLLAFSIAISAKPVLEQKSPMKSSLIELRSLSTNHNVVEHDRRQLKSPTGDQVEAEITTAAHFQVRQYSVDIMIGYPPTTYKLILDSGSSITWIGANKAYVQTNTSQKTNNQVKSTVICGNASATFSGLEFIDVVTFGDLTSVFNPSIVVASETQGFDTRFDGVLGIGPTGLTKGTLSSNAEKSVTDSLSESNLIHRKSVAIAFKPYNQSLHIDPSDNVAQINWGGIEPSQFNGNITYARITKSSPANEAWGIDLSLCYGDVSLLTNVAGIVDTGATNFFLDSDAYNTYRDATRAVLDPYTNLLTIPPTQINQLKELNFTISDVTFTIIPDAQIMPQHLNILIGGITNLLYLIVHDIGTVVGLGGGSIKFILGMSVLGRFYCDLDADNKRIGFANTDATYANLNLNTRYFVSV